MNSLLLILFTVMLFATVYLIKRVVSPPANNEDNEDDVTDDTGPNEGQTLLALDKAKRELILKINKKCDDDLYLLYAPYFADIGTCRGLGTPTLAYLQDLKTKNPINYNRLAKCGYVKYIFYLTLFTLWYEKIGIHTKETFVWFTANTSYLEEATAQDFVLYIQTTKDMLAANAVGYIRIRFHQLKDILSTYVANTSFVTLFPMETTSCPELADKFIDLSNLDTYARIDPTKVQLLIDCGYIKNLILTKRLECLIGFQFDVLLLKRVLQRMMDTLAKETITLDYGFKNAQIWLTTS